MLNIPQKILAIALLAASIFGTCLNVNAVSAQQTALAPVVSLTAEERAWLAAHPDIRLGYTDTLEPEVIVDPDGTYSGMLVDFLDALNERLGTRIGLHVYSISEVLDKAKTKSIDGIPNLHPEYADSLGLLKTQTYWPAYFAVFARKGISFTSPDDFTDKRVAIIDRVHITQKFMDRHGKQATIVRVDNALEGLQVVENGTADLFLGFSYNSFFISKYQLFNVVTAHVFLDSPEWFGIGIRKDWPVLISILDKGIASFSKQEIHAIITKWSYLPASKDTIKLTAEERDWLKAHPDIQIGYTAAFEPEVIVSSDGTHRGILVDFLDELNRRLGTRIRLRIDPIPEMLEKTRKKETDGILYILPEYADKLGLLKTEGHLTGYAAVFARKNVVFDRPSDFAGKKVAIIDGVMFTEKIVERYGDGATILKVKDALEGLQRVDKGEADLFLGASINAYFLAKYQLFGLTLQYVFYDHPFMGGMAIRSDWPELVSILNKGISSFSEIEIEAITAEWIALPEKQQITVELTVEERAWLAQNHTVRVRVVNFPPYIFLGEDEITGIAIDYLKLVAQRSGVTFEFVHETRPWQRALESLMKSQGPDLVTSVSPIAERKPYMNFSAPYIESPRVIFTRTDAEFISGIDELKGRSLAVPHGTLVHKRLEEEYPDIALILFDTDLESIEAVSTGKADAYIGNLVNASYEILQKGFVNLKIAFPSPFGDDVYTFGIRKDWPELVSIINKALDTISVEEEAAIRTKHFKLQYEHGINPADILKWILIVAGGAFGIIFFFVFWNRTLAKMVSDRTAELESSNQSLATEVVQRTKAEQKQRESRNFLKGLMGSLPDAVFLIKFPERVIVWINDTYNLFGYEPGECVGQTTEFLYPHRKDFLALGDKIGSAIAQGDDIFHIEQTMRSKSGALFPADINISIFRINDNVVSVTAIVRNISEHKKAVAALQESKEKFRHLVEQSPLSIQVFNTDGQLIQVNEAWKQLWGVSEDLLPEVVEKWNILEDEEARQIGILPLIQKAFTGKSVILPPVEYDASSTIENLKIRDTDTKKRWVQARFYPITNSIGKVVNVVGIEEDITNNKKAEKQILQYQERLKGLSLQLTIAEESERRAIAADLHDQVGHSLALARMQLNNIPESESELERNILVKDVSNILLEALQDTRNLIFELSSPSMNEIGLGAAISEWLEDQIGKRHGLETEFFDNIDDAHRKTLDENIRALLFRNVRELLVNVVKHARASKVCVRLLKETNGTKIVVEDNGVGFDFDAIKDKDSKEGGFGLFSIQERMADLGGSFEIQSAPGKGCKVVLTVPVEGR